MTETRTQPQENPPGPGPTRREKLLCLIIGDDFGLFDDDALLPLPLRW